MSDTSPSPDNTTPERGPEPEPERDPQPVRKRVEALGPDVDPDATTDELEPLAGPLKPLELCRATGRPGHRYVGPYGHCGDCGAPEPEVP